MGKTLGTIAIGAALVGLAFATGGASLVGTAALTTGAGVGVGGLGVAVSAIGTSLATTALGSTLLVAGGGAILSGALGAVTKKPGGVSQAQVSRTNPNVDPATYRTTAYGRTALSYNLRYAEWNGNKQDIADQVACLASHAIESLDEIWLGAELAWTSGGGSQGRFANYFFVNPVLEGGPGRGMTLERGVWTADSARLTGCAWVHLRFLLLGTSGKDTNSPFYSGLPSKVTFIGKGAKLYDPRRDSTVPGGSGPMRADDQSTWRFIADDGVEIGNNSALQILHQHLGWRINGKLAVGAGLKPKKLDLASFAVAANLCDELVGRAAGGTEPRFRTAGIVSEGDESSAGIGAFLAGCCGRLRDDGGKISLAIMHNDLALAAADPGLTTDDVLSGHTWDSDEALTETPNVARGKYTDSRTSVLYQLLPYPEVTVPSPDGIERPLPLDLGTVESVSQAQRVAKQTLARRQSGRRFTATFDSRAWRYKIGSVVPFTYAPLSFNRKLFRVEAMDPAPYDKVEMTLAEEDANFYLWDNSDSAPVQPATPLVYDAANNPYVQGIQQAATTSTWAGVTGTGKPDDNATNSGDPNSPFGPDGTVASAKQEVAAARAAIQAVQDAIRDTDLGDTGAANAAKQAAEAARDAAAASAQTASSEAEHALSYAQTAQGQAQQADLSAASAATSARLAATFNTSSLTRNSVFADWPDNGNPANWITAGTRVPGLQSSFAVQLSHGQALEPASAADLPRVIGGSYFIVEIDLRAAGPMNAILLGLQAYDDSSAAQLVQGWTWQLGNEKPLDYSGQTISTGNGELYRYRLFVDARNGAARNWRLYAMVGSGSTVAKIDRFDFRFASNEEALARQAYADVQSRATITQLNTVAADQTAARGQLSTSVDARFARATPTQLSNDLTTLGSVVDGKASYDFVVTTVASEAGARSTAVQDLRAESNGKFATITQFSGVQALVDGRTSAYFKVAAVTPGGVAQIDLVSDSLAGTIFQLRAGTIIFSANDVLIDDSLGVRKLVDNAAIIPSRASSTTEVAGSYASPTGVAEPRSSVLVGMIYMTVPGWIFVTASMLQGSTSSGPWTTTLVVDGIELLESGRGGGISQDAVEMQGWYYAPTGGRWYRIDVMWAAWTGTSLKRVSLFGLGFPKTTG